VSTAKRIVPSAQRAFTSVWVLKVPICTPEVATPAGNAKPNVAHPEVKAQPPNPSPPTLASLLLGPLLAPSVPAPVLQAADASTNSKANQLTTRSCSGCFIDR
jgi:hypothetical protein